MSSTGYTAWAVTAGEQPTTAYWNILGENDASFNSGSGFNDGIITTRHLASGIQVAPYAQIPYKFKAYRSSAYTPSGAIVFNTVSFDTGNNYSTSTGAFTAPVSGFYLFNTSLLYTTTAAPQDPSLNIWRNGTEQLMNQHFVNMYNGTSSSALSATVLVQLAINDYVYVSGIGYALEITGESNQFSGVLLSAT